MVHRRYQYPNQWLPYAGAATAGIAALHGANMFGHRYPQDTTKLWRPRKYITESGNMDVDYEEHNFSFVPETHKTSMKRKASSKKKQPKAKRPKLGKKKKTQKKKLVRKQRKRIGRSGPTYVGAVSRGFFSKTSKGISTYEKVAKKGISVVRETGPTGAVINAAGTAATAFQCVAISHVTCSPEHVLTDACRALVKYLAKKLMNHDLINFAEIPIINGASVDGSNTMLEIFYRVSLTASLSTIQLPFVVGVNTWESAVGTLYTAFRSNMTTNFMLDSARSYNYTGSDTLRRNFQRCTLTDAKIMVHVKSALKIQNQSRNVTGDEDSIDNIPLHGKQFDGSGNFCYTQTSNESNQYLEPSISEFTPPTATYGAARADPWAEPPRLDMLKRAKKQGAAHLDPGEIRTSVLTYTKTFWLSGLLRKCNVTQVGGRNQMNIGNFRAFFFEKMINSLSPGTNAQNQIVIAYEHDHKTAMMVTSKQPVATTQTLLLNVA